MKKQKNKNQSKYPGMKLFAGVIIAAVFLRLIYFLQITDSFLFQTPILDAKYYHLWALEILKGDLAGRARGVFMMSPGYSYLLAAVYWIMGVNITAVAALQFLSGAASGVIVYFTAKKFYSRAAAFIAMALYLFYAPGIFFESALLKASFINFFNVLALYLLALGGPLFCALSGVFTGLSVQLRPNALLLAPVFIAWIFISGRRKLFSAVLFVCSLALVLLPVALRNYKVGGEFVVATAHGGMNLFTGNSQFCLGPYTPMPFARTDPEVEQEDFLNEARRLSGKNLTPAESSAFWTGQSLRFITGNPFAWGKLIYRKALIFLNNYEPQINLDYYFFRQEYNSVLSSVPVTFGVIMPAALLGMIFGGANFLLLGYFAVYFLSGLIFFVVSEYRFPAVPALAIYAGYGITLLFQKWKEYKIRELFYLAGFLAFFVFISNIDIYSGLFGYNSYKRSNLANSYFGMGVTYEEKGLTQEAIASYEKALEIMPQTGPLINMAGIYERRGDLDKRAERNAAALRIYPGSAEASNNLGAIMFKKGKYLEAAEYFTQALSVKPDFEQAKKN